MTAHKVRLCSCLDLSQQLGDACAVRTILQFRKWRLGEFAFEGASAQGPNVVTSTPGVALHLGKLTVWTPCFLKSHGASSVLMNLIPAHVMVPKDLVWMQSHGNQPGKHQP